MMQVYEKTPDFIGLYGDDRGLSGRLTKVYNNIGKTGGPFHKPLSYANAAGIKAPYVRGDMEIQKLDVLGFYTLRKMKMEEDEDNIFFDAELLLIAPPHWTSGQSIEAARKLREIEASPDTLKCCMAYEGSEPGNF